MILEIKYNKIKLAIAFFTASLMFFLASGYSYYSATRHVVNSINLGSNNNSKEISTNNEIDTTLQGKTRQYKITSNHKDFTADSEITLNVDSTYKHSIEGIFQQFISPVTASSADNIKIEILKNEKSIDTQEVTLTPINDAININTDKLTPGAYTLVLTSPDGKSIRQDFTWGVLAINTNKATYRSDETVKISMAVLDDKGEMVCDGQVKLTINNPKGESIVMTTESQNIKVNEEVCKSKDYTITPDYETRYQTTIPGKYKVTMQATTNNGTYSIEDSFTVEQNPQFDVKRSSATRIYPYNIYPMIITVKPSSDYEGTVSEKVPENFTLLEASSEELTNHITQLVGKDVESGQTSPTVISKNNGSQEINWAVNWEKDKEYTLVYFYDTPDISPNFYFLGELQIDTWQEYRKWQLAIDASGSGTNTVDPTSAVASSTGNTHTFTYDPADTHTYGGELRIKILTSRGWSTPQGSAGSAGYTTASITGTGKIGTVLTSADATSYGSWTLTEDDTDACQTANPAVDASVYVEGSGSIKCDNSGATQPDATDSWSWDHSTTNNWSTYDTISYWIRSSKATDGTNYINFGYSTDADLDSGSTLVLFNTGSLSANTWTYQTQSLSGTRTAIKCFGLASGGDGFDSANQWLDEVLIGPGVPSFVANGSDYDIVLKFISLNNAATVSVVYGSGGGSSGANAPTTTGTDVSTTRTRIATSSSYDSLVNISSSPSITVTASNDTFTGNVYSDEGTTPIQPTGVCAVVNNGTPVCDTTIDVNGAFSIDAPSDAGDQLTFYIDGGTDFGNMVTVASGGNLSSLKIYENHVVLRDDNAGNISIAEMDAYDNSGSNPTDMLFDATDSTTDTLTVEDGNELYISSGETFEPLGNLESGSDGIDDIKIVGTYTATSSETIRVSGTWLNSGTFTAASSTVKFDATGGTESINSTGASTASFNNLTLGISSGSATWNLGSALDVNGTLTIDYGTLGMNGSNNITTAGVVSIGASGSYTKGSGTWTFDGTGSANYTDSTGTQNIGDITIDAASGTRTVSLQTATIMDNLTIASDGVLAMGTQNVTIGNTTDASHGDINVTSGGSTSQSAGTVTVLSNSGTTQWNGSGTFTANNLTIGTGSTTFTIDNETNDLPIDLAGNFTISANATFTASTTAAFEVASSWSDSGTFTPGGGTSSVKLNATSGTPNITTSGSSFNYLELDDTGNNITWTLQDALDVNGNLTITGGTLSTGSNRQVNVGGTFTNNDIFTANSGIFVMDGSSGSIAGTSNTSFYDLTVSGTTITLTASDPSVTHTLTISSTKSLSLNSGRILTVGPSATISLAADGSIVGDGTLKYQSSTTFPTTGTVSSLVQFDSTSSAQTIPNRTFSDHVELYNNSGTSRIYSLGTTGTTVTFSGNLIMNAASGAITLDASANNPPVDVTGNLDSTSGGSAENITTGTGTWTVTGNVDLTDIGSFTVTGGTFQMNGGGATLTSAGKSFNNFKATGGSPSTTDSMNVGGNFEVLGSSSFTHAAGTMTVSGTFTVTSGGFIHGAGANIDILVGGNFTLQSGTTWNENTTSTSQLIFTGDLYFDDNTASPQSLGNVQIGNSPGTTYLSSDMSANSLTVSSGDIYYTCGWEVDIGNGGITIDGTFNATRVAGGCSSDSDQSTINDANLFNLSGTGTLTPDQSTVIFDDASGTNNLTTAGSGSFYNMQISNASNSMVLQDALDVDNNLTINSGTLDAGTNYQINVGGNWTNDGTFNEQSGKVVFDGGSSMDLDSGCATVGTCTTQNFYDVEINKSGGDADDNVNLTLTHLRLTNTFTITDGELIQGTLDVRAEGSSAVSVASGGKWTNTSTGDLILGGSFANSGTVTFQGNGASCGDTNTDLVISSTASSERAWSGAGTFNFNDASVSWQGGSATIFVYNGDNGGNNNTNWIFGGCPVNFTGNVYNFGTANPLTECDANSGTHELQLRATGYTYSTSCSNSDGSYTFSSIAGPATGDGLVAWIDHAVATTAYGAMVVRYDGAGASDNNTFYDDAVTITSDNTTGVDIDDANFYDNGDDGDIPYTANNASPDTLSVNSGFELLVLKKSTVANGSTVFDPNGTVTTNATGGDLHVAANGKAILDTATNSIGRDVEVEGGATLDFNEATTIGGGDITTSGTSATVSATTGNPTVTISGTGDIGGGTNPSITLYNLETSGSGTITTTSTVNIGNNLTVGTGTTLDVKADLNVTGSLANTTTGVITSTSGVPIVTVSGSSIGGGSGNLTFYKLTKSGGGTTTFSGSGTNTINNDLSVSSGTLTLSNTLGVGGNATVNTGATFNINGSLNVTGSLTNTTTGIITNTSGTPTVTVSGSSIGGGSGDITIYNLTKSGGGSTAFSGSGANNVSHDLSVSSGTLNQSNTLTVDNDVSVSDGATYNVNANLNINGGDFTTSGTATVSTTSGSPTVNISGTGVLGGGANTITFYQLTEDGVSSTTPNSDVTVTNTLTVGDGANAATFEVNTNDKAVSTLDLVINASGVYSASSNTSSPLTVSRDFTNNGSFNNNGGKIVFDTTNTSTLSYSATTTFNEFSVTTAEKHMEFDSTNGVVTDIDGLFTLQGNNCTTGRVFLDPDTPGQGWDIAASGSTNIDYIDVEYSTASPSITAENSTQDNGNNSGWTINEGACGSGNNPPDTPTNSSPSGSGIARNPTLTSSAFSDTDPGDTHSNSQWQISTATGGSFEANIVWDSGTTASNLTSVVVNTSNGTFQGSLSGETRLDDNTTYYFRVRHQDNHSEWSVYSTDTSFTTDANVAPNTPSNNTPAPGATNQSINPTLTSSAFSDNNSGDIHTNSQWQISTATGGSFEANIVWDSGTTASNLTSVVVNTSNGTFQGVLSGQTSLANNTMYYWRLRHRDDSLSWSSYSTITSFTTSDIPNIMAKLKAGLRIKGGVKFK